MIAASVAAVELCLLLVVGLVVFGKFFGGQVEKATDPAAVAKAAVTRETKAATAGREKREAAVRDPVLSRRETAVIVLNGNGVPGAAGTMAEQVRARLYTIAATDNAPELMTRSAVMYRPGFDREAKRLAHDFGVRRVSPLDGLRRRDLQGAHLALVLGAS